jgi:hypothetical protein
MAIEIVDLPIKIVIYPFIVDLPINSMVIFHSVIMEVMEVIMDVNGF